MSKVPIGVLLYFCVGVALGRNTDANPENVITTLWRTIQFMKENAKSMNVDAIFGLILAQANLESLMQQRIPKKFADKVRSLEGMANETQYELLRHLEMNEINAVYLRTIFNVEAWQKDINFGEVKVNRSILQNRVSFRIKTLNHYRTFLMNFKLTEEETDECFMEILKQQQFCCVEHRCSISPGCQKLMIKDLEYIEPAYAVTHYLLFYQVARSQKCILNDSFWKKRIQEYCSYIYWEVTKNYQYGFVEELDDLVLEQVALCAYEGYAEFLQEHIVEHILSLQGKEGCFKYVPFTLIKKRAINLLEHGCADHTTGLGAAVLSVILRYQLREI